MTEELVAGLIHLLEPEEVAHIQISQPTVAIEADRFLNILRSLRQHRESLSKIQVSFGGRVLLVGPVGTDFRTFANRLSTEFPIRLAILNTSHLIRFSDRLPELVQTVTEYARRNRPVLLYIEQLHSILKTEPAADIILQSAISGMSWDNDEVLMVASTTRPEELTPELASVFDRCLVFRLPSKQERQSVLESFLKGRSTLNIDALTESTEGWSHTDLLHLVAALYASGHAVSPESAGVPPEQLLENSGVLPLNTPMALQSLATKIGMRAAPEIQRLLPLYPDDFLDQLYLMAVGDNYTETSRVVQTLNENLPLDLREQEFLLRYPFVLAGSPEDRLTRLARAKKTVDRLSRVLGR